MQKRFIKYQDNLVSDDANNKVSGVIPGSVYRGFDQVSQVSGLTFGLNHTLTGEVRPDVSENLSDPTGIWVSRQGVTIKEDAPIPLAIISNSGNAVYRNDYVIGRHHHDVIFVGGVVATYEVIKGPLNSDTVLNPSSISRNDWVILGVLRIPPNATDATGVVFQRSRVPSLGNQFPALLNATNRYTDQQQEYQGNTKNIASATLDGISDRNSIIDLSGGNLFEVNGSTYLDLLQALPFGTEIKLYFLHDVTLRPFVQQLNSSHVLAGYSIQLRPIVINFDTSDVLVVKANQIATFRMVNIGGAYGGGSVVFGDFWKLTSVSDSPAMIKVLSDELTNLNTALTVIQNSIAAIAASVDALDAPGTFRQLKIYGNIADFFDASGRGLPTNIYPKHQICNGQLDTPDMRDAHFMGFTGEAHDWVPNSTILGLNDIKLVETNFPAHTHKMFGVSSGNTHLADSQFSPPSWNSNFKNGNQDYIVIASENSAPSMGTTSAFGTTSGALQGVDVRGKHYYCIVIMRLTDAIIAANPIV